jgi:hypothetical protein
VGVSTKANIPTGSSAHFCRMGTANATVFPEPVLLPPMQSLPFNISGMQSFWMPVGLFIAMAPNECTSQGFTVKAEKVVVVSTGANIPALLVDDVLICDLVFTRDVRDGTESLGTRGTSISEGETFLRFREAWESRESESETSPSDSDEEEEVECSCSDEADASSDVGLIICGLRAFSAAIEFPRGWMLVASWKLFLWAVTPEKFHGSRGSAAVGQGSKGLPRDKKLGLCGRHPLSETRRIGQLEERPLAREGIRGEGSERGVRG